MADTISSRLLGRGTSKLPIYCKKKTNEHQQLKSFVVKFEFRHQLMNQRRLERNELIINEIYFHQLMAIGVETKAASSFLFFLCHVADEDGKAAATLHTKIN